MSRTARFTAYTAGGFDTASQTRLRDVVVDLARRGCHVLLSSSTAREIQALYIDCPAPGLRAFTVPARRAINSRGAGRGPVLEYLITNLEPRRPKDRPLAEMV
jgi:DNA adenine methylase